MAPAYSVISAMFCYAMANLIIDQKLTHYNTLSLMVCWVATILVLSIVSRELLKTPDGTFDFPSGWNLGLVLVVAAFFFCGDYLFINAYNKGGNLYTITILNLTFPVFASLLKLGWTGELPNRWQVGGYLVASGGVWLIIRGNELH